MVSGYHQDVAEHYETFPYPDYPFYALGNWKQLQRVDVKAWGATRSIEDIWIAGCGTIAPLMFGRRNPQARILGSDLSEKTLKICQGRLSLYGIRNVQLVQQDIFQAHYSQIFDAVDAYGVIHHTVSPEQALKRLSLSLRPGGVIRFMVYAEGHRNHLEQLRHLVRKMNLKEMKELKKFLKKNKIQLEGDLSSKHGIADALLHPIVHTYNRESLSLLLGSCPELETIKVEDESNYVVFSKKR